jgi:hypothetical protein
MLRSKVLALQIPPLAPPMAARRLFPMPAALPESTGETSIAHAQFCVRPQLHPQQFGTAQPTPQVRGLGNAR